MDRFKRVQSEGAIRVTADRPMSMITTLEMDQFQIQSPPRRVGSQIERKMKLETIKEIQRPQSAGNFLPTNFLYDVLLV